MKFSIPEMNFAALEEKLAKIQRKAIKYGFDFHFEQLGTHFEEATIWLSSSNGKKATIKFIDIEVSGEVKHGGYEVIGHIGHT
jgi:hypothetical protein